MIYEHYWDNKFSCEHLSFIVNGRGYHFDIPDTININYNDEPFEVLNDLIKATSSNIMRYFSLNNKLKKFYQRLNKNKTVHLLNYYARELREVEETLIKTQKDIKLYKNCMKEIIEEGIV